MTIKCKVISNGGDGTTIVQEVDWHANPLPYICGHSWGSHEVQLWITETLKRLPEEVLRFALHRCTFTSAGVTPGRTFMHWEATGDSPWHRACIAAEEEAIHAAKGPEWETTRYVIVLDENMFSGNAHANIAHHIAEAWIDDHVGSWHAELIQATREADPDSLVDHGYLAAVLAKSWGFAGEGAEPERYFRNSATSAKPIWPFYDPTPNPGAPVSPPGGASSAQLGRALVEECLAHFRTGRMPMTDPYVRSSSGMKLLDGHVRAACTCGAIVTIPFVLMPPGERAPRLECQGCGRVITYDLFVGHEHDGVSVLVRGFCAQLFANHVRLMIDREARRERSSAQSRALEPLVLEAFKRMSRDESTGETGVPDEPQIGSSGSASGNGMNSV